VPGGLQDRVAENAHQRRTPATLEGLLTRIEPVVVLSQQGLLTTGATDPWRDSFRLAPAPGSRRPKHADNIAIEEFLLRQALH
jgi:hypothetical protein